MFAMLDEFEDTSMTFTKIAMRLRVEPDEEELLTKLDSKTKLLEEVRWRFFFFFVVIIIIIVIVVLLCEY
jgi:hypothetical protein